MRSVRGKTALITGGAGGIGRALGAALTARGATVRLADVHRGRAQEAAGAIAGPEGRATGHVVDVTDPVSIATLRGELEALGPIDVLVNNAGIVRGGAFTETALEAHLSTTAVNLDGVMAVTHAFLPELVGRTDAHIVNVVSASAFIGLPYGASYAASKWGALGFSESLRAEMRELGHRHVGVTAVCPAYVDTGMFAGAAAPTFTRFLTPDRLASAIVRGIEHNVAVVRTPWTVHLGRITALLPTRAADAIAGLLGVDRSMRTWRGHPTDPE